MATLAPICRGCSRPIILFRNSGFQSIKPYNQTTRVAQWPQPNCARVIRRAFATKVKIAPPASRTSVRKIPPATKVPPPDRAFVDKNQSNSPKSALGKKPANTFSGPVNQPVVSPPPPIKHSEAPQLNFAQSLASNDTPTTLYEVEPQKMFLFSSYTAGFFCIAGAAVNIILNVYNLPEGMHFLVPVAFGAMGIGMAIIGTRYALMPSGVVRSIKVLPARSVKNSDPAAKAASSTDPPVRLQVEVRRSIPFMYKRFEVDPKDISMVARLYNLTEDNPPEDTLLPRNSMFKHFRRGITGEGFAPIFINDVQYKLDIIAAYVLDEGRALDRIVRIKKSPIVERLLAEKKGR
ncbi:uncharacterized protein F4807DRAFT_412212 [Annulohypoxylon truncatum]|uniref:uncharacterized protein n=1 Tax=Annulohypoxylon truncatum TaxID=327061 RepID=UPI002007BA6C|nr:uncharacterized protein F4807DRAFT_412212 [Annulohypoxylon truncatum]KAI1212958.1 hypothetical protein F4807DRAFT_412212 [Annulohypoxylon truncatum]